jgi:PAS domain S-box-containing protein
MDDDQEIKRLKTALQQARRAVQASETRFRNVIERNADGMIVTDRNGIVQFTNPAASGLLGRPRSDILGLPLGFPITGAGMTEIDILRSDGTPVVAEMQVVETEWEGEPAFLASIRDISERKAAEARIRLQAQLLDAVDEAIIATDMDGTIFFWNHVAEELYGWPASEAIGQNILDVTPAAQKREDAAEIMQHLRKGESWSGEFRVRHRSGRTFPIQISNAPIFDDWGGLVGIIGVSADITERKKMEEALKENEARFRLLAENAQDIIFHLQLSPEQRFEYVSPAATAITGYTPEDHYNDPQLGFKLVHPDDRPLLATMAEGGVPEDPIVLRWVRKDGRVIWTEQQNVPILDDAGNVVAIEGIARDITERKEAEIAVRQANERLSNILNSISDGFFVLDEKLTITYYNTAAERLLGRTNAEVLGRPIFEAFPEAKGSIFEEKYRGALEHMETDFFETYFGTPPFENWYDVRVYPFEGGITVYFQITTERKRDQRELEEKTRELERSNAELQQFAYAASHDLQEPLRAVTGFIELLQRRYGDRLDERAHEYIGFAIDGAYRMRELINGLLAFSRVESQGGTMSPTDAEAVVDDVLRSLSVAIVEADAVITHDPLPTVMADDVQLRQVFQNLISNAIKFQNHQAPEIHISARSVPDAEAWQFAVRDNGIGIDPSHIDRIFVIFQRLHTREEYPGTGLGLAVCKKIIERHHGRIWVESQPGEGATFYFTLPSVTAEDDDRDDKDVNPAVVATPETYNDSEEDEGR